MGNETDNNTAPSSDELFATEDQSIVGGSQSIATLTRAEIDAKTNEELVQLQRPEGTGNPNRPPEPREERQSTPEAYQKIQSQRDAANAELNRMKAQLEEYQHYTPALRILQDNPQILEQMVNKNTQTVPTVNAPSTQPQTIVKPERPSKPKGFSRFEAQSEPDSESAKYLDAKDDYDLEMEDYRESLDNQRIQASQEQVRLSAVKAQERQYLSEVERKLVADFQFTPERVQRFMTDMSQPNPSLAELVQLDEIRHKLNDGTPQLSKEQLEEKAATMREQQKRSGNFVLPPTGGITTPPKDANKDFNQSLGNTGTAGRNLFERA